jgi:hypothetical protein
LLNQVQAEGRMDLIRDYALQIPTTIIAEMLGVPIKDRLKFHRWSNAAIASTSSGWGVLRALPHAVAFLRYIRMLVKARRANPEDDCNAASENSEPQDCHSIRRTTLETGARATGSGESTSHVYKKFRKKYAARGVSVGPTCRSNTMPGSCGAIR